MCALATFEFVGGMLSTANLGPEVSTVINLSEENLQKLRHLADLNGVATNFWDWSGKQCPAPACTLIQVLDALGIELPNLYEKSQAKDFEALDEILESAIRETLDLPWEKTLPPCTVLRYGVEGEVAVHVPHGTAVRVWVHLESGDRWPLQQLDRWVDPRQVGEVLIGQATFALPGSLPLGYHQLVAVVGETNINNFTDPAKDDETACIPGINSASLIVTPQLLLPQVLDGAQRYWGVNVQAYSVRSKTSWGVGDAEDLADLTAICAVEKADFVLINPVHATEPISPVEDSPYLPVSRRWMNLTYIRPENIPEYSHLGPRSRSRIEQLRVRASSAESTRGGALNRDASWKAKMEALEIIFPLPRSIHRQAELDSFISDGGTNLYNYALWAALVEYFGSTSLPSEVSNPKKPESLRLAKELEERIHFFQWCQWVASQQLKTPNQTATTLGMRIGIMADLAVGVHRLGSEYWANQEQFAATMSVGAPPDMYSQQGQNWSQPPWNPRVLESLGYEPLREVFRASLSLAGAVRIDHILGLFRLWWIPGEQQADKGTYVYYDHEAMVGILLLEAHRAGALVIGEDLGTVEPWVRQYLAERGILGTSVLWFEKESSGWPLPADEYRRDVLATVNTHDLPPTAGYMEGVQTTLRDQLGLLVDPVEEVRQSDMLEQDLMKLRLMQWGLIDETATKTQVIEAMHRYVARTPSRLVAAALVDAVGEKQPQNLPGTHHEYPNWRIPLSDGEGSPLWLDDLADNQGLQRLFAVMRQEMSI